MRSTVQGHEFLTGEFEGHGHGCAFGTWAGLSVAGNVEDFRIREERDVELCGVFGLIVAALCLLAREVAPAHRGKLLAAALMGLCLMGVTLGSALAVWPTLHEAVVVGHAIPVRVSPTLIEEPIFTLPEAEIVSVRGEYEGFMLIKTGAGRTGWAPQANLGLIVPPRP